ncbi:Ig-like domain-containing protein [Acinetobacter chinensis]|uniref:Ig-like domain-containing protein n=1 Tax=Acinetobacter chinensis TaxID=2004650 RepID=UPI002935011F|nr:Ig-like domain-containing protein [Acinetobacter chinensis]WOE42759.1 Ig-like domain-containing protein [Acinetobacter chinensis]
MKIKMMSKVSGKVQILDINNNIKMEDHTVLSPDLSADQISHAVRQGNDLLIVLKNGEILTVQDYFLYLQSSIILNGEASPLLFQVTEDAAGALLIEYNPVTEPVLSSLFSSDLLLGGAALVLAGGVVYELTKKDETNKPADLGTASINLKETDAPLSSGGQLSIRDKDDPETFQSQVNTAGKYGHFSIDQDGKWQYLADSAYNELAEGETLTEDFIVFSSDGTRTTVSITITGTNDLPVIGGTVTGVLTEDMTGKVSGQLTVSDADTGDTHTWNVSGNGAGQYGSFTVDATGKWSYQLNSTHKDVQALAVGESLTDTVTVTVTDKSGGTDTQVLSITVNGSNDLPVLSGVITGNVVEDSSLTVTGQLSVTDTDLTDTHTWNVSGNGAGQYGSFTVDATGKWSYQLNSTHKDVQALAEGESLTDTIIVMVNDGNGGAASETLTITILGTNDAAILSSVTEVLIETDVVLTTGGTLTITDVDSAATFIAQTGTVGDYGTFSIDAAGAWTYVAFEAYNGLNAGDQHTDTFDVFSADGTKTNVTVIINGSNDAPVAVADSIQVAEGGTATVLVGGAASVLTNDSDAENNLLTAILVTGPAHGTLTLNADGTFSYVHDGSETTSDSFTYKVNDGTVDGNTVTVQISVTPVNDAPVAVADSFTVVEGGTISSGSVLTNDSDADGDTLTAILVTGPAHGTLTLNTNGTFSYVHNGSETTSDSFTYKVNDGTVDGNTVTVQISVTPVNDAPVAVADSFTVVEGGTISSGSVLVNDSDADGDTLTAILVTGPAHGTLTLNTNGTFSYVHNGSETTSDSFTYKVNDGTVDGNTVTVQISVTPVNDAPVAVADSFTVVEGGTISSGSVLVNDSDADGDTLTAILVTGPAHGTLTLNADGTFSYVHNGGETTSDSFTYKVNDGTVDGNTVTVQISVTPVNDAPVAVADSFTVVEGGTISSASVLTNDSDADGNTLTAILVTGPAHGTLTLNADGTFSYVHNGGETTSDSFTYKVNDGTVDGNTVTVQISVTPVNDAPVAVADSFTVVEGGTISSGSVLTNDSDAENNLLTAILVTGPAHGTLTLNTNGTFSYVHDGSETTSDSFTYKVNDGTVDGNTVTVQISVTPVNDAPVAVADSFTVVEGGTISSGSVLTNDSDADGDTLTAILVTGPAHGRLTLNADGTFSYVHNGSETTSDSFTYKVNDGTVDGNTVTVQISVTPVNDAPVAVADSIQVAEGGTATVLAGGAVSVLVNDNDADGNPLTAILVTGPAHGTLTLNTDGTFSYVHDGSETTTDSFTYKVNDGTVDGNTVTVQISVTPVNDAPVAVADSFTVVEGGTISSGSVLTNDSDADGDTLTAILVTGPAHGTLTLNADGTFSYVHNGGETTSDSFTYKVNDGTVDGNTVTVQISVTPVNDAPVAVADSFTVVEGGTISSGSVLVNDSDADGDTLTAILVTGPAHGTLTLNTNGTFSYVHNGGETTSDSFTYKVNDGTVDGNTVTMQISVTPVNDVPVAVNDTTTVDEGSSVTVAVRDNDTDAEQNSLTVSAVTQGTNGSVVIDAVTGNPVYTPDVGYSGTDSFTYTVSDGQGGSSTATVNVTVNAVNHAPEFTTTGEFPVNTYTDNNQNSSSVTALSDGGFVVTWQSNGQDGSGFGIYAQRYAADGQPQGGEFRVNTYTASSQYYSSVTALSDGGFVVTWQSNGQDSWDDGIYAQRYVADGQPQGGEFRVNTYTVSSQDSPSVTALSDGGFVVTWQSIGQDSSGYGVYAQRYAADGQPQGGEFQVNTYTYNWQDSSSVTALSDGGFVVTWQSIGQDSSGYGVYAQRYAADGQPQGGEFQVNTYTYNWQDNPSVTALSDGGFVVTWQSNGQDGLGYGIYGQRYAADGQPQGGEFKVNTYTTDGQFLPSVTALSDGGFVVTWQSNGQDGSGYGVYAQRYAADGQPQGGEFQVNTYTYNWQDSPSVTALSDGGFVVTWSSNGQDGSGWGIYAQRYDKDGVPYTTTGHVTEDAAENTIKGQLQASDADAGDTLTYSIQGSVNGTYGSLTVDPTTGLWIYSLDNSSTATQALGKGQTGTETFKVRVTDSKGGYDETDIVIQVLGGNDVAVIKGSQSGAVKEDTPAQAVATGKLSITDLDAGEAAFKPQISTSGTYGSFSINAAGEWAYTLDNSKPAVQALKEGETKTESFTVSSLDGTATTVTVTITGTNDAPVVVADNVVVPQNVSTTLIPAQLLQNDTDIDGGVLSIISVQGAVNGTVRLVSGNVQFIPATDYEGPASFSYTVSDSQGGESTATVYLGVGAATAPGVVVSKSLVAIAHGTDGTSVKFPVTTALVDTDGSESLSIKISGVPTNLSFNAGINMGSGVWQFTEADLPNLILNLPGSYTTNATQLTVQVTATEMYGNFTASTSTVVTLKAGYTTVDVTTTDSGSYTGSSASEYIQGGTGDNTINGNSGNNVINGGAGNDNLSAGSGSDVINGGSGNDTINAGSGSDRISGGAGNDILKGGDAGENFVDLFMWALGDQGAAGTPALDTIENFATAAAGTNGTGGDVLDLSDLLQGESVGASNSAGNLGNYLHFEISGNDTLIHISHTGGFTADSHTVGAAYTSAAETQQIKLSGVNLQSFYAGATTDSQIITQLLNNNKLIIG